MNEPAKERPAASDSADLDASIAELWGEAGRVEFIEANGIRFEVGVMGDGPKLALCLHGFPEHFISWRHQAPLLAERGYTVWAPNLRGYGRTDRPKAVREYRLPTLMADVAGLWDAGAARGLTPSLLMAHDWGAIIAWAFVLNRVRPVERYVPINLPHPAVARRGMWRGGQMLKSWYITFFQLPALPEAGILAGEARKIAEAFRGDAGHPENFSDAVVDAYRRNALRPGAMRAMINYYRANYVELAAGRTLVGEERSDTPTLMIWGAEDRYISAHLTEGTDAYMSDFKLLKLPGISHWAQQDAPEAVNAALADWLPR